MSTEPKPLLLIDVDGVLNPWLAKPVPHGYEVLTLSGFHVLLSREIGAALCAFADRYELTWATTWEHEANELIGPNCGIPTLPVIEFERPGAGYAGYTWKLPGVMTYAGDRPLIWIDDDLGDDARTWAERREAPTLLLEPSPWAGITPELLECITQFAADLAAGRQPATGSRRFSAARQQLVHADPLRERDHAYVGTDVECDRCGGLASE